MVKQRDYVHDALKWVSYNRGLVCALIVAGAVFVGLVSCVPKVPSIIDPNVKVTAPQFEREVVIVTSGLRKRVDEINTDVTAANKIIELAKADLERQEAIRLQVLEVVGGLGTLATTGGLTAPAAAGSLIQLLTLAASGGLFYDNRRKDKLIQKSAPSTPV